MSDDYDLAHQLAYLDELAAQERWHHDLTISDEARAECEALQERMAIIAESSGQGASELGGLVPVSTRPKRGSRRVLQAKKLALATTRAAGVDTGFGDRSCLVPDVHKQRVSKLRQAVGFSARAHGVSQHGHRSDDCLMITLTYRDGADWQGDHVMRMLDSLRKWCARHGIACRYTWVAELQKRGAIHYHIAVFVPHGVRLPMPDKQGWWKHGSTNIEVARNAVPYLMKYLSKGMGPEDLAFPKHARVYGVGGLEHSLRRARRWLSLPAFVKARSSIADDWKRADGGGWTDPHGKHWPSEYEGCIVGGVRGVVRVRDHGRPFEASGPFSWCRPH